MSEVSYTAVSVDEDAKPWMRIQAELEKLTERVSMLEKTSHEPQTYRKSAVSAIESSVSTSSTAEPSYSSSEGEKEDSETENEEEEEEEEKTASDDDEKEEQDDEEEQNEEEEEEPPLTTEAPTAENIQRIVMAERPKLRFNPRDAKTVMSAATAKESVVSVAAKSTASSDASFYDGSDLAPDV